MYGCRIAICGRYYLLRRYIMRPWLESPSMAAGDAGRIYSNLLLTTSAFDPVALLIRQQGLRGAWVNGYQGPHTGTTASPSRSRVYRSNPAAVHRLSRHRRSEILDPAEPLGVQVSGMFLTSSTVGNRQGKLGRICVKSMCETWWAGLCASHRQDYRMPDYSGRCGDGYRRGWFPSIGNCAARFSRTEPQSGDLVRKVELRYTISSENFEAG